jgi:hypothetical protein
VADWRILHEAAVTESNVTALAKLVHETEQAIDRRMRELSPDDEEYRELKLAADELRCIKVEKLGSPDSTQSRRQTPALNLEQFDIFSGDPNNPLWLESVQGIAAAVKEMHQLAAQKPGPYFIFSVRSSSYIACVNTTPPRKSGAG